MLTTAQYLKLEPGDQVRLFRGVYTVTELNDVGSHMERELVSESGDRLQSAVYIAHLMSYHGKADDVYDEGAAELFEYEKNELI
jgi:hypothetical protein